MVCIHCGKNTKVVNSRLQRRNNQVWRRRQCLQCQAVFTTEEGANYDSAWLVTSQSGAVQPFSRDKLFLSLIASLEHRKSAVADAGGLAETIIKKLGGQMSNGSANSRDIANITLVALKRFDSAAGVHYSANHKLPV